MNIFEMHIGVNLGVQKIASHINGDLLDEEVDYYLNNSINDYIKQQYSFIKNTNRGIENQYIHENLRKLLVTAAIVSGSFTNDTLIPNAKRASLPENYKYYISSFSVLTNDKRKNNVLLQPQVLQKYIGTETNSPIFRQLPIYLENDSVVVIGDGTESLDELQVNITYIKKPNIVKLVRSEGLYDDDNSTEPDFLPDHTHKEIVDMTIQQILKDLTQFKGQE